VGYIAGHGPAAMIQVFVVSGGKAMAHGMGSIPFCMLTMYVGQSRGTLGALVVFLSTVFLFLKCTLNIDKRLVLEGCVFRF
jgi:hypothetical protein